MAYLLQRRASCPKRTRHFLLANGRLDRSAHRRGAAKYGIIMGQRRGSGSSYYVNTYGQRYLDVTGGASPTRLLEVLATLKNWES